MPVVAAAAVLLGRQRAPRRRRRGRPGQLAPEGRRRVPLGRGARRRRPGGRGAPSAVHAVVEVMGERGVNFVSLVGVTAEARFNYSSRCYQVVM